MARTSGFVQIIMFLSRFHSAFSSFPKLGIIGLFYLVVILVACEKMEIYDGGSSDQIKERLFSYEREGITVDALETKEDYYRFSFSDGTSLKIFRESIQLVTIDARGFWCINMKKTNKSLDESGVDCILEGDNPERVYGIVEGYTVWDFYFGGNSTISLGKTLYSINPDIMIRGINHRGFCVEAPENTLPAYRLSKLRGFNYVETDIRFTADSVPVLIHDATVDRTSDGYGAVKEMTWEDISRLDFGRKKSDDYVGTRIPSLPEFLELCRTINLFPYLELKTGNRIQIQSLVKLVDEYDMKDRVTYISFTPELLRYVLEVDQAATVGYLTSTPMPSNAVEIASSLKTEFNSVFIDSSDYSELAVSLCRDASIPLEIWTIDSKSIILSLSSYITGVTSNSVHAGRLLVDCLPL